MFNAEDIIDLEKKWFKYKVKQKSKLYIFILLCIAIFSFVFYKIYSPEQILMPTKPIVKKIEKESDLKQIISTKKIEKLSIKAKAPIKNTTVITKIEESNETKIDIVKPTKIIVKKDNSKPFHFKLKPTDQGSELFSSNGFLTLNVKNRVNQQNIALENNNKVVQPIRETQINTIKPVEKKPKAKISIDMEEIDTIAYLKDKYYATSSIVFALMLAEEYYYEKKYNDSLKWSLTANDIDSQNTKSWYWFAKSKVKLGQKEDATRALQAYLSNNSSKRLSTLLHKIELGDTDD